ncbi:MAG: response regulator transcription factor [Candidatus Delongbacteria bacterium]|nr:response regulator transcription factor [Candidatus Delongbacteria bacterium]MBN2835620.1 response regulator transcription factor [Candidatus Delongbacteria bacterium]
MNKYKILVVDDETDLCEILEFNLIGEGFEVETANSAEEALTKNLKSYHLILLDIMMGKISGTSLAKMMKKDNELKSIPIIFLTAKDTEMDKLIGFNIGADDYIIKPFSVKEVVARINAVLKRTYSNSVSQTEESIEIGGLKIDDRSKKVFIDEKDTKLTRKEYDILYLLVKNQTRVFSRGELLDLIWDDDGTITDRTVDVNIRRIRQKLEDYGNYIKTRSGYGYCFERQLEN